MAKATVRTPDTAEVAIVRSPDTSVWLVKIGQALSAAIAAARWSHKEASGELVVDDAELGKWLSGARRAHLDRLLANDTLRRHVLLELMKLDEGAIEVVTEIRVRQRAGER